MKKLFAVILSAVMAISFTGCAVERPNGMVSYDFNKMNTDFIQLKAPQNGDTIAIIDTDYGEIRAVLYPQYAPNTVQAFIDNANSGKYNNMPVKGVENDMYFLTGGWDNENGEYVGRNDDKSLVMNEYTPDLWPYRGALMSFSEKKGYGDARWLICNTDKENVTEDAINKLMQETQESSGKSAEELAKIEKLMKTFLEKGGLFAVSGERTVFGQTYEGLDVVEKLTHIPTRPDGSAKETVLIKSVTISTYEGGSSSSETGDSTESENSPQ